MGGCRKVAPFFIGKNVDQPGDVWGCERGILPEMAGKVHHHSTVGPTLSGS